MANWLLALIKVPVLAESITEGEVKTIKSTRVFHDLSIDEGEYVKIDEPIASLETAKAAVEIKSPINGRIMKLHAKVGQVVLVGNDFAVIDETQAPPAEQAAPAPAPTAAAAPTPAAAPAPAAPAQAPIPAATPAPTPVAAPKPKPKAESKPKPKAESKPAAHPKPTGAREERRVKLSMLRRTAADRLKKAQNTCAMLTTFNECDMSALSALRKDLGEDFFKAHGARLGFMSAFVRASVMSLQKYPVVNASIQEQELIYHDYVDLSVAVSAPKGLLVPVLRNCETLSFSEIEKVEGLII